MIHKPFFPFIQLIEFEDGTTTGAAKNARLKALEKVKTNVLWIQSEENEIIDAFGVDRKQ